MKPETLFESLEYLDETILEESEAPVRRSRKRLAAAACICVAGAGVFAAVHMGNSPWHTVPAQPAVTTPVTVTDIQVPGPNAAAGESNVLEFPDRGTPPPEADTLPAHPLLHWNTSAPPAAADADMAVMLVSEPLTARQLAMSAPDSAPAWLDFTEGYASYYLRDGKGGLESVVLTARNSLRDVDVTVQIFDPDTPRYSGSCIMEPEPETTAASYEGTQYTAYQYSYLHGEGDPALYPPKEWLSLRLDFLRGGVAYRLSAEAPAELETDAKDALADILYCYAHSEGIPDLSSFHCRDYLLRDASPTLEEARADPDFGAYLPEAPEGFPECDIRRYQFEEVQNYLHVFWYSGYDHVDWLVSYAGEKDLNRLVSPEDKTFYDLSLYPIPWSESVPRDRWEMVNDPVFRAEELTPEMVRARSYTVSEAGDTGGWRTRFSVLFADSVMIRIEAKGVSPDWIFEQINALR